jgi:hypothetical protein
MMKRYFKLYSMAQGHRSGFSGSVFRNASSRTGAAPSFDGEMSNLYSIVSEQHRHEKGEENEECARVDFRVMCYYYQRKCGFIK